MFDISADWPRKCKILYPQSLAICISILYYYGTVEFFHPVPFPRIYESQNLVLAKGVLSQNRRKVYLQNNCHIKVL